MPARIRDIQKHFWDGVEVGDPTICWPWMRRRWWNGYGIFFVRRRAKIASRIAYEFSVGQIPDGLFVLHRCDNRACCNPSHLFIGTKKDNTADCIRKGRFGVLPGSKNHQARFHESDVLEMRRLFSFGKSLADIARLFSTTSSRIHRIVHRKEWTHI